MRLAKRAYLCPPYLRYLIGMQNALLESTSSGVEALSSAVVVHLDIDHVIAPMEVVLGSTSVRRGARGRLRRAT